MKKQTEGWTIDTEEKTMSCYGLTVDNVCGTYQLLYGDPGETGPLGVLFTQSGDQSRGYDFDVLYIRKGGEWWAVDNVSWMAKQPELRKLDENPVQHFLEDLQRAMVEETSK